MEFYKKKKTSENEENKKTENNERISKQKETYKIGINNTRKKIIIAVSIACTLILILAMCTGFALINSSQRKVTSGVKISGMKIGGLTREEAEKVINQKIEEKLDKDIVIKGENFEYTVKPSQIEVKYDVKKAIDDSYNVGRNGNIFSNNFDIIKAMIKGKNIEIESTYDEKLLENILSDIQVKIPDAVVQPSYYIEDSKLIINKGTEGNSIDKDKIKEELIRIITDTSSNDSNIQIELTKTKPEEIDIEKIHEEVYKEPKDAYYTKEPFQIFEHQDGIDFDLEAAKELLKEDKEEYEIELIITKPEVTISEIGTEAFPDLLSTFTTKYDASNIPRSTNLTIAMKKLDGVVVAPGETFSYNKTLGKRTVEQGYREANGFAGGRIVPMLAGGICQISSTLYDAVVYANLEIVERHNHMFLAGYVGAGKDATVVYGSCDFQFKNTRKYPIMIKTSIGSGVAKISIFGIKEDVEYEVEISTTVLSYTPYSVVYEDDYSLAEGQQKVVQSGMNGCRSITYKILKLNGNQVSSEVLSTDTYDAMNKIVKRGASRSAEVVEEPEIDTPTVTEPEPAAEPQPQVQPQPEPTPEPVVEQPQVQPQPEPTPEPEQSAPEQTPAENTDTGEQP